MFAIQSSGNLMIRGNASYTLTLGGNKTATTGTLQILVRISDGENFTLNDEGGLNNNTAKFGGAVFMTGASSSIKISGAPQTLAQRHSLHPTLGLQRWHHRLHDTLCQMDTDWNGDGNRNSNGNTNRPANPMTKAATGTTPTVKPQQRLKSPTPTSLATYCSFPSTLSYSSSQQAENSRSTASKRALSYTSDNATPPFLYTGNRRERLEYHHTRCGSSNTSNA